MVKHPSKDPQFEKGDKARIDQPNQHQPLHASHDLEVEIEMVTSFNMRLQQFVYLVRFRSDRSTATIPEKGLKAGWADD